MSKKLFSVMAFLFGFVLVFSISAQAASVYEGKTIRIIVGYSAGGGYDTYARVFSRHMGRHIPGNPSIIVENMTGAGSLISANHMYRVAKPDGLTLGHFNGGLFLGQVLGQPGIEFDARKFEYIGAAVREDSVLVLTKASGITSTEKWMASKSPVKLGGTGPGSYTPDNFIKIVRAALGLPIQLVSGYKGTADIRLASEGGELAGSAWGWASIKVTWRKGLESGDVIPILQGVAKPFPELPNVPLAINLAKTDEARRLIEVGIHSNSIIARPFVAPPGTPKEQVQILRKAFHDTLNDKEFLAETEKSKLDLAPVSPQELEKTAGALFELSPDFLAKLKEIVFK